MKYYVYFLRCQDQSIYIGISHDVKKRFQEHLEKKEQNIRRHILLKKFFLQYLVKRSQKL